VADLTIDEFEGAPEPPPEPQTTDEEKPDE
jgi:hypothetical protein